ncbi:hypothetical protein [Streptomyces sp. TLI_55]|uniref:hypothetical protein n=1 Tax=Streptomyces sp. TLI_55 TaxID=1938861 RepID=UPI000BE23515|nr:hypothetical protein [Streptomyces sp. TLI_55]
MRARRVRSDSSGLLASYRPSEELARAELTCPSVIPTDDERPTALTDLGPACPPGLWVRSRERLGRLTDSTVAVTGNRVPTARQALGIDATAGKATAYHRTRVATATAVALHRSGHTPPMTDNNLADAVLAPHFPSSIPSAETRASIHAALAVQHAEHTVTITH